MWHLCGFAGERKQRDRCVASLRIREEREKTGVRARKEGKRGTRVAPLRIRGGEETKGSACGISADSREKRKTEETEKRKEGGERGTGEGEKRYEGKGRKGRKGMREEGKKGEMEGMREKIERKRRNGRRKRCGQTRKKKTGKLTVRRAGRGGATRGWGQKSENFCHFFQKNREKSKLTLQCKELVGRKSVECFILLQLICLTT